MRTGRRCESRERILRDGLVGNDRVEKRGHHVIDRGGPRQNPCLGLFCRIGGRRGRLDGVAIVRQLREARLLERAPSLIVQEAIDSKRHVSDRLHLVVKRRSQAREALHGAIVAVEHEIVIQDDDECDLLLPLDHLGARGLLDIDETLIGIGEDISVFHDRLLIGIETHQTTGHHIGAPLRFDERAEHLLTKNCCTASSRRPRAPLSP